MNVYDGPEVAKLISGAAWMRPDWSPEQIAAVLSSPKLGPYSFDEVRRAAMNCWSEVATEFPGRLLAENGGWWARAGTRSPDRRAGEVLTADESARDLARRKCMEAAAEALRRAEPQPEKEATNG